MATKPANAHGSRVCGWPLLILKVGRKWANGQKMTQNHVNFRNKSGQKVGTGQKKWANGHFQNPKVGRDFGLFEQK